MPVLPVVHPTQRHPGARWLVSRVVHPRLVHEAWVLGQAPAIEVGHRFDVIHLPAGIVEAAVTGIKTDDAVEEAFRRIGIGHGVVVSRRRDLYTVLVRPGTARTWQVPGTVSVGSHDHLRYLRAPHPEHREGPGAFWLLPVPDQDDQLAEAAHLLKFLSVSRGRRDGGVTAAP
ncbi:hypothetical protein I5Q34_14540 [Streptomyces sp. AV19]|uniref:hypothetical protein n=1 Tax=Streptomyces sp. AV19 TaxID=2793068 RepID=UPI0018FE8B7C|nr:hypothetical protein [Streptomyces sp. AV19]MBH1935476.1 hypothetical protein [Streptomyces sp. AV19]MDG4531362.1 hypothetical protein [Streptomyces sp. AV19]